MQKTRAMLVQLWQRGCFPCKLQLWVAFGPGVKLQAESLSVMAEVGDGVHGRVVTGRLCAPHPRASLARELCEVL